MNKVSLMLIFVSVFTLSGCKITPTYEVKKHDSNFNLSENKEIGVIRFDSQVTEPLNGSGNGINLFGAIGVLLDSAVNNKDGVFALALHNESIKIIETEFHKSSINFKASDLVKKYGAEQLKKDFESNRLWGTSSLKENVVKTFFNDNPDIKYGIHVKSFAHDGGDHLQASTWWIVYDNNGSVVNETWTRSVKNIKSSTISAEEQYKVIISLQHKNIQEFITLVL